MGLRDQIGFNGPDGGIYWQALRIYAGGDDPGPYLDRCFGIERRTKDVVDDASVTETRNDKEGCNGNALTPGPGAGLDAVPDRYRLQMRFGEGPGFGYGSGSVSVPVSGTGTEGDNQSGPVPAEVPVPDTSLGTGLCSKCGEEFQAVRRSKRYCSSRCRVSAHRQRARVAPAD